MKFVWDTDVSKFRKHANNTKNSGLNGVLCSKRQIILRKEKILAMETPRRALRNLHLENVQKNSTPLKIPPSPALKDLLGYGTGVNVYKLERSPKQGVIRSPWAIKRVSKAMQKDTRVELTGRLQEEAEILRKLSHPNIVGFRGVTKIDDGLGVLALECCKTSLGLILEDRLDSELGPLPAENTYKFIKDIASALDYLHTEAKLLHGDLKSFNILVKGDFEICKLCDFGVSLKMNENGLIDFNESPNSRYVGTSLWCAPEVIDEDEIIDCKADIFSFGLCIYETIALIPPHTLAFNNNDSKDEDPGTDEDDLKAIMESIECGYGSRPPLPDAFELNDSYNQIVELFYCCTQNLPEERPSAKMILKAIQNKN